VKAIIYRAGSGNRLIPLTPEKPKGMPETGSQTIMQRQLEIMGGCGIVI
jgi:choline kinase